jgi:copper chaperone NosL
MRTWMILCLPVVLAACQQPAPWPPSPASLRAGEDTCAHCRMIVSEARHAAQFHTRTGSVAFYDDLGCLLERHAGPDTDPQAVFAGGDGATWIPGTSGYVVRAPGLTTPMGSGLAAFATSDAARAEAARRPGAAVFSLRDLLRTGAPASRPAVPVGESSR